MNKKIEQNLFKICTIVIICVLFIIQLTTSFFGKKTIEEVLAKNDTVISTIYANKMPPKTFENNYFSFSLPKGMQVYAQTDNNIKLRSGDVFYTAHILTSTIDTDSYARETFANGIKYSLPNFRGQESFSYVKELNTATVEVAIYNDDVEVLFVTPRTQLESNLLKAVELLRNIHVEERADEPIFIGTSDGKSQQTIMDKTEGEQVDDEGEEVEIKVKNKETNTGSANS